MAKASAFYKEHQKAKNQDLRPADLEGKYITVTGVERYGESTKFTGEDGKPRPFGIFNVEYANGSELLAAKMICSGALFELLSAYFSQEPKPEEGLEGRLIKGKPYPGATMYAWMLVDPEDVADATENGLSF